jgi:hypothetical protein
VAPPRPLAEPVGTAAEPDPAAAPLELGAVEEPAELVGAPGEPPGLLGAAGEALGLLGAAEELLDAAEELLELVDAAAVPFELEPKTEPVGLTAAETLPGLTGRAEAEAKPTEPPGVPAEPPGLPETEAEPDTEARPLLGPLTGAALTEPEPAEADPAEADPAEAEPAEAEPAGLELPGDEPAEAEPAEAEPAGVELTGADAEARAVGAVPEDAGRDVSVPDAGAHSAPGAGGGGSSYPWSLFGPALLAGGRAAGGVLPSLSGFACCSSMGPPDRRHPRADATCRTPGRPIAGRLVTTVPHQRS